MSATVAVVTETAALERLRPQWEDLAAEALEPNPFFEHWLLLPALRARPNRAFRAVCITLDGKLAGFFPFERHLFYKGLPVPSLSSWLPPHGLLCTPLVDRRHSRKCISAFFDWVQKTGSISMVRFRFLPASSAFRRVLADVIQGSSSPIVLEDEYSRGLLCRGPDADTYINSAISRETRQKLRRYKKRLLEAGKVTHRTLDASDDVEAWIKDFLAVEASGWKGARGSALACQEGNRRFAYEVFNAAFARGRLMMVGIDLDGRPISRYTGFVAGETAFAFKTAYDESYRQFAPGLLTELDMIHAFHALPGVARMDSNTASTNSTINRFWKDRLAVQRSSVPTSAWGRLILCVVLPFAKQAKGFTRLAMAQFNARFGRLASCSLLLLLQ